MSCKFPDVCLLLTVVLSVLPVTTQSFFLKIHPETSSSMTVTPSLGFLTAFSSLSLLIGHVCTHLSDCLCAVYYLISLSHLISVLFALFSFY